MISFGGERLLVIHYKTVTGKRAESACIQMHMKENQTGQLWWTRGGLALHVLKSLILMSRATQSFSITSCATTALWSLYHINTPHTLACASKAPLQHSKWGRQWDPAKPPVSWRNGGGRENRDALGTGTAASLWVLRINNPALMQHGIVWPVLTEPCQTGLR